MSNAKVSLNPLVKSLDKIKLCVLKSLSRDQVGELDPNIIPIFLVLGYLGRMLWDIGALASNFTSFWWWTQKSIIGG